MLFPGPLPAYPKFHQVPFPIVCPGKTWLREWKGKAKVKWRKAIVNMERLMMPSKWVTLNCYRALLGTGDLEVPRNYAR